MFLTYENLDDNTKGKYHLLFKLGQINYDLVSCITLMKQKNENSDLATDIYCSKQLFVHINEAYKFFKKNIEMCRPFVSQELTYDDRYKHFLAQIDFDNKTSMNSTFFKSFRSDVVHYNDSHNVDLFYKYANGLKDALPELECEFSREYDVELKSLIVFLNMFVIEKEIEPKDYAKVMSDEAEVIMLIIEDIKANLLKELEG